jgi:hypothetical protein
VGAVVRRGASWTAATALEVLDLAFRLRLRRLGQDLRQLQSITWEELLASLPRQKGQATTLRRTSTACGASTKRGRISMKTAQQRIMYDQVTRRHRAAAANDRHLFGRARRWLAAALDDSERAIAAMMKSGPDGRSFLDRARKRHAPFLKSIEVARPPDCGLRSMAARG